MSKVKRTFVVIVKSKLITNPSHLQIARMCIDNYSNTKIKQIRFYPTHLVKNNCVFFNHTHNSRHKWYSFYSNNIKSLATYSNL